MATIRIKDLTLYTIIGTNKWERIKKQKIVINASIEYNSSKARATDNIEEAVDYKAITKTMIHHVRNARFFLLEKLTDFVLKTIMENKKVKKATVRIDKPLALRFAKSVSVELSKKR